MADWLTSAYGIKVEKVEIQRPGGADYIPVKQSGKGVLHTTEGNGVDSVIARYRQEGFCPHFTTGLGRIVQHRPLWAQSSTLRTGHAPYYCNEYAQVQIEQVGFSKTTLYDLPNETRIPSLHLIAALVDHGIPLVVPQGTTVWRDDCSDCSKPLAADNSRRRSRRFFGTAKGWFMHMEVPDQDPSWHWDCGAIRRTKMLMDAAALIKPPTPPNGGNVLTDDDAKQLGYTHVGDWRVQQDRSKAVSDVMLGLPKRTGQSKYYMDAFDKATAKLA